MTVSNQTNRTSATGTNAIAQEIAFSFPITDTSDLTVLTRVTATGVEAPLTETTNYTVTISGDTGGTVTMVTAVADTSQIHVIRNTPMTQALDLEQGGTFNAENVEDAFDKLTKLVIDNAHADVSSNISPRVLTVPKTDDDSLDLEIPNSVDRASKYLTFDSSGNVTATASVVEDTVTFGAFGTDVAATATEAAFKTLANLEAGVDFQAYDAQLADIAALAVTNGNFIVGDGTNWVAESGATARTSLGLAIGTNVQAWDALLDDIAALSATAGTIIYGDGTDMVSKSVVCNENQVVCNENSMVVN